MHRIVIAINVDVPTMDEAYAALQLLRNTISVGTKDAIVFDVSNEWYTDGEPLDNNQTRRVRDDYYLKQLKGCCV